MPGPYFRIAAERLHRGLFMSRLPPIRIEGRPCEIPLSEPTATALLFALLCESKDPESASLSSTMTEPLTTSLAEALTLDPALALWTSLHHASATGADQAESAAPSIAELAAFLAAHLPKLLAVGDANPPEIGSPAEARSRKKPADAGAARSPQIFAKLAQSAVQRGEDAAPARLRLQDGRYISALLHDARRWLTAPEAISAETLAAISAALPAWIVRASQARKSGAQTPARRAARVVAGAKSKKPAADKNANAQAAAARWLVPPGLASQQFMALARRLLRQRDLETNFAERLLEEKLHALGEFAAGAGHEINNPLAVISGRAQLFLRHEADPERRRELAVINTQARRVHEMIADLMLFARPPEPRRTLCEIPSLVRGVMAELTSRATERRVSLRYSEGAPSLGVMIDATQLQVALRAVLENALDAVADGGAIDVSLDVTEVAAPQLSGGAESGAPSLNVGRLTAERALAIAICDDGPGVDPAAQRNLFDPFYSGRGAGRGIGMGLSKCWRIVTEHGGRMEIENRPTGGASVRLLLPLAAASPQESA